MNGSLMIWLKCNCIHIKAQLEKKNSRNLKEDCVVIE